MRRASANPSATKASTSQYMWRLSERSSASAPHPTRGRPTPGSPSLPPVTATHLIATS